jgi:hypothetical protein
MLPKSPFKDLLFTIIRYTFPIILKEKDETVTDEVIPDSYLGLKKYLIQ